MSANAPADIAAGLEPAVRAILGDALTAGDSSYAVDGLTPALVATPRTVEALAAILAVANAYGAAVIPWGAGRHMALGNVPTRYDLALHTTKLNRVIEYEPADLTIAVEAGITMRTLQALLAERGQFLPIDAPAESTAGGVLAANVSGPSRHAYGLPRDWLIGCRVAHADGSVSKGGGRVVKNVAGYDMPKLAVGSLGTLGVIVEATFKLAPLPAAQQTLLASFPAVETAIEAAFAADERSLSLRAVAVLVAAGAAGATAAFWLGGTPAAVERTSRELHEITAAAPTTHLEGDDSTAWWAQLPATSAVRDEVAARASVPPSAVAGVCELVDGAAIAYPTTGLVDARLDARAAGSAVDSVEALRRAARDAGGSLVVTSAPIEVKQRIDVWDSAGTALQLMRRLKEQFDPSGTLNPGRFVGGI